MSLRIGRGIALLAVFGGLALSAHAQDLSKPEYNTWGIRLGVADDPDQFVGGVHFDFGAVVDRLRFQPNFEIGLGDDTTIAAITAPLHYHFDIDSNVTPYAGGGLVFGWIDRDRPVGIDDDDFEIGLKLTGGAQWRLRGGNDFFLELNLVFGDLHDIQVMAGWTF